MKGVFCDIGFTIKDEYLVIVTAEDNLLKGAAAQATRAGRLALRVVRIGQIDARNRAGAPAA